MRIIAGLHRGRRLLGPVDANTTRPITDRVKTALFDRLSSAGRLDGAVVADLFSGTGSMGIECLSRGAAHVTFVERDRVARDRLAKNIDAIGQADQAQVLSLDALGGGVMAALQRQPCTLAFVDPPYRMLTTPAEADRVYQQITRLGDVMMAQALVVLRVEEHIAPLAVQPWGEPTVYQYGSMLLCFYQRVNDGADVA